MLLLFSSVENFLAIAFRELLKTHKFPTDVESFLLGRTDNFSIGKDFPLFCSLFLPEIYVPSEIQKRFIYKRNRYAHHIIDRKGEYVFKSDEKYSLSEQELDEFFQYFKALMKNIATTIDKLKAENI